MADCDSRLTPDDLDILKTEASRPWQGRAYVLVRRERLERVIREVELLGGPKCVDCLENKARYTSHRCALCDSKLPPDQRGVRL